MSFSSGTEAISPFFHKGPEASDGFSIRKDYTAAYLPAKSHTTALPPLDPEPPVGEGPPPRDFLQECPPIKISTCEGHLWQT